MDRSIQGTDFRLLSPRWNTVERVEEILDIGNVITNVAVRDADSENENTFVSLNFSYNAPRREARFQKPQSEISAESAGQAWLDQNLIQARVVSIKPNLRRVLWGRDFDLGDRIAIQVFHTDEILIGEIHAVKGSYSSAQGERINMDIKIPYAGMYGV